MSAPIPIPVTIIAGFLGTGKTTLLNRILSADHGLRVGVIVNDFGSLAFDEELADAATTHSRMLANGCVCCSIENDLIETLAEMVQRDPPLDAIVIEASGVADPLALVASLQGARLGRPLPVRAVVTVADAGEVREQEQDYGGELVLTQLRAASLVVLNKCDLTDPETLAETRKWLGDIGVTAAVRETVHGDVPLDLLLQTEPVQAAEHTHAAPAAEQFEEWSLQTDRCFDVDTLRQIFEQLPAGIIRAKGSVELPDGAGRVLLQFAAGRLDLSVAASAREQESGSRIVAIGAPGTLQGDALHRIFIDSAAA